MAKKSPMQKFTIKEFQNRFPDDDTCLEWLRRKLYPEKIFCTTCRKPTKHYKVRGRKVYTCEDCSHHFSPTAGTIFHKSPTPLTTWFYVIYLMAQTRGGISAKQIQRETGVTYKCAWRMCNEIRKRLGDNGIASFAGQIEVDESYFGGKNKGGKRGRGSENKTPVVGIVQRQGKIKTFVVSDTKSKTVLPIVEENIEKGSQIFTDEYPVYDRLSLMGYSHERVTHSENIYVIGKAHTNTIEGFWSTAKNGIKGVFHSVSPKYLQDYLDEYAFRYNHRDNVESMYWVLLSKVSLAHLAEQP